jgi:hypothetical protein
MTFIIPDSTTIQGNLKVTGTMPATARSAIAQDPNAKYVVPWGDFRVFDAYQTLLPGTPLTDDLGLVGGTAGSASPSLQTEDLKTAGATSNKARFMFQLPPEYDAGETVTLRVHAGMLTTVSDTTATVDASVYKSDKEAGAGADICATAATTINSLTLADVDFTITPTTLAAGDWLDVVLTTAINDAATGAAVKGVLGEVAFLLDVRG